MQKSVIVIFFFCLFGAITFSAARCADPLTLALEQILSDITFEIVPYPTYPELVYEPTCQCGGCPYYNQCGMNIPPCYLDAPNCQCGMPVPCYSDAPVCQRGIPAPPCYCDIPSCQCGMPNCPTSSTGSCRQCGDICPGCNCYRDVRNPCGVCEEPPMYNYFDNCGCNGPAPPPYIYFPEVEYPMTAMDVRPYFYGSCWCS